MTRYGMAIDKKRCVACNTCCVGCKVENNLPQDMWWNKVVNEGGANPDSPSGTYPSLAMSTYTLSCQHCMNPACVSVCPSEATYRDAETGIVMQDSEKCIGCGLCLGVPLACAPCRGRARVLHRFRHRRRRRVRARCGHGGEVRVLHHRVSEGEQPFCVVVCPGRARTFGDLDDPDSDISKLIASRDCEQLNVDAGTGPSVYLLV
ncbi:MAG: 4Fe-4S dicluster domain-containing protein [Eggerthellaceae bacterium]